MSHLIYQGQVIHTRIHPVHHHFEYPIYMFCLEITETNLSSLSCLLSINSYNLFSIFESDYLIENKLSIVEKFKCVLNRYGFHIEFDKVVMLTMPRLILKTFNPITLYYVYSKDNLILILAEVTNTFHEKHLYILPCTKESFMDGYYLFNSPKNFYVSPFSKETGIFDFKLSDIREKLDVKITYKYQEKIELTATLRGKSLSLNSQNLLKVAFKYPFTAALTLSRILFQAACIHYFKKHKARRKKMSKDIFTLKKEKSNLIGKLYMSKFKSIMSNIKGSLEVRYPNGEVQRYGSNVEIEPPIVLDIFSYQFFKRIVASSDIGLAESWMNEEWNTSNLTQLIALLIRNKPLLSKKYSGQWLIQSLLKVHHALRSNSLKNSPKNIEAHYDLGNDFYKLFLDKSMSYSCGYYETASSSLEDAQEAKIKKIIKKLQVNSTHHVLEIGSGWGHLAIMLAQTTGCKVTSITLSKEQYAYACDAVKKLNLQDQVFLKLEDYRLHKGLYDRIVSIEMIEAVGHDYLEMYFNCCERNLKEDGIMMLQAITMSDPYYKEYCSTTDFIRQYIFPGAHLPSLSHIANSLATNNTLMIDQVENIGPHYALTLQDWRKRFDINEQNITKKYSQRFFLMWQMYFSYCEAAFQERYIHDVQLILTRPQNSFLINQFKERN